MSKKPKFRVGEVVFCNDGEYIRVLRIGPKPDLGEEQVECFNTRWGGKEIYHQRELRRLTKRERGAA